jgi:plasmid replication initiation protein
MQPHLFDEELAQSAAMLQPIRIGRDEMNLAEFPFSVLSKLAPPGLQTLQFYDVITTQEGVSIERRWTVTGSEHFGLPTATDEEVYIALMEVTKEHGFESRTVPITRYDLIRRMGWRPDGRSYDRLELSLDRLKAVTIKAENAFWDNAARRYVTVAFGIIDNYVLIDGRQGRAARAAGFRHSFITWNEVIFNSFRAGNLKMLDTDLYFSLRSPIARRLYRYLDKKRYGDRPVFQIGVAKLAFEHLGMSRSYYPSQLRRKLDPAHRELIARGYLAKVEYGVTQSGAEKVIYYFAPRREGVRRVLPPESAALLRALVDHGVTLKTALDLIQVYPADEIAAQLAYLPYRAAREPAAVLVQSIREDWAPPAAYLRAQREQQAAQEALAGQQLHAPSAAASREAVQRSRREAYRKAAQTVLSTLGEEEQGEIRAEVEQTMAENYRYLAGYQSHPVYRAVYNEELVKAIARRFPEEFGAAVEQELGKREEREGGGG